MEGPLDRLGSYLRAENLRTRCSAPGYGGDQLARHCACRDRLLMVIARGHRAGIAGLGHLIAQRYRTRVRAEAIEGRGVIRGSIGNRLTQREIKRGGDILTLGRSVGGECNGEIRGQGAGRRADLRAGHLLVEDDQGQRRRTGDGGRQTDRSG